MRAFCRHRRLTLGGGIGILGRKYSLTCDHLLGAQIVLADGLVVECDDHQYGELFRRFAAPEAAT